MTDQPKSDKPKIKWPAGVQDVTAEMLGKTIVIIGSPAPVKPKPSPRG